MLESRPRLRSLSIALVVGIAVTALWAPSAAQASSVSGADLLASLVDGTPSAVEYDRAYFPHWMDDDGDGCDTRREVLIAESVVTPSVGSGCVVSGEWRSLYDGVTTTDASTFDIDHVVALAEAWDSGAWSWTTAQRRAFANDLGDDRTLRAVTASSNRSKGADDPAGWLPSAGVCEYVLDWVAVKYRWSLTVDALERATLDAVLSQDSCGATSVQKPVAIGGLGGGSVASAAVAEFTDGVHRRSGSDRYVTALAVSASFTAGVPVVYVATGAQFPDALSAAPAAAVQGGPLLLVPPAGPTSAIIAEITRLSPDTIVVVGGESAVSAESFSALSTLAPSIRRDAGPNRYETSRIIVERAFSNSADVFLATGRNFPDALSASAAAGHLQAPVLLVDGAAAAVPTTTRSLMTSLGAQKVRLIGGASVVSNDIESSLVSAYGTSGVVRHAGPNRYATAAAVNSAVFSSATTAFFASGSSFPDALSGAALAGALNAPLYVVQRDCVPSDVLAHVTTLSPTRLVLLGGTSAVGAEVGNLLDCASLVAPPPAAPANPGDSKNCSDFSTQREAQAWFDYYFPYYGDIARLDANNDGVPCESLP